MADILVVDDEIGIRELLSEILGDEGHHVLLAESAQQARELRAAQPVDLVLLDIWMPDTDGVTLLREWSSAGLLSMPVIMMSGHATIDTAVEATRIGAIDFLEKPITLQKLLRSVQSGLTQGRTRLTGARPAAVALPAAVATDGQAQRFPALDSGESLEEVSESAGERLPMAMAPDEGLGPVVSALASPGNTLYPHPVDPRLGELGDPATALMAGGGRTSERGASLRVQSLPLDAPLRDARDAFERVYFEYHLQREQGSMTRVAERTGLERTHLYRKLKQLGIDLSRGVWRKPPP
jgi:DNA-binding NtrC family response regulator